MKKIPLAWKLAVLLILLAALVWCIPGMKFSALFILFLAALCVLHRVLALCENKFKYGKVCKVIFRYGVITFLRCF